MADAPCAASLIGAHAGSDKWPTRHSVGRKEERDHRSWKYSYLSCARLGVSGGRLDLVIHCRYPLPQCCKSEVMLPPSTSKPAVAPALRLMSTLCLASSPSPRSVFLVDRSVCGRCNMPTHSLSLSPKRIRIRLCHRAAAPIQVTAPGARETWFHAITLALESRDPDIWSSVMISVQIAASAEWLATMERRAHLDHPILIQHLLTHLSFSLPTPDPLEMRAPRAP